MPGRRNGTGVDLPTTGRRASWTVVVLLGASLAVIYSYFAWDQCEVDCTFARQKAPMYLAVPAGVAALIALAAAQSRRIAWATSFGIAAALLCAWLIVLFVNP
jgi:hypothetical protein